MRDFLDPLSENSRTFDHVPTAPPVPHQYDTAGRAHASGQDEMYKHFVDSDETWATKANRALRNGVIATVLTIGMVTTAIFKFDSFLRFEFPDTKLAAKIVVGLGIAAMGFLPIRYHYQDWRAYRNQAQSARRSGAITISGFGDPTINRQ